MSAPEPPLPKAVGLGVDAITDSPPSQVDPAVAALASAERAALEKELIEADLKDRAQDRTERLRYTSRAFWLVVAWLSAVALLVVAQGFRLLGFRLSDPVMIALLGTTTVSVIGIFLIVAN